MRRAALLVVLAVLAACSASDDGHPVSLRVAARTTYDQPLAIRIAGLDAGQRVSVVVRTTSATGATWASTARYVADDAGRIDVPRDGTGPLSTMRLVSGDRTGGSDPGPDGTQVRITVRSGDQVLASTEVERVPFDPPVVARRLELDEVGFVGDYYASRPSSDRGPAVLLIGGSEGGIPPDIIPALLGRHAPTLAIAYFGHPGLPAGLSDIPLEYFATALRWLAQQPGVDPERVRVVGFSRGGEAALLVASMFPDLVHGAVGVVPSAVIVGPVGEQAPGASGYAWTLGGGPAQGDGGDFFEIRVERIDGPVLTLAGADDDVWDSATAVEMVEDRLDAHDFPHRHDGKVYEGVGHLIGVPHTTPEGGRYRARAAASIDAWRRIFELVRS